MVFGNLHRWDGAGSLFIHVIVCHLCTIFKLGFFVHLKDIFCLFHHFDLLGSERKVRGKKEEDRKGGKWDESKTYVCVMTTVSKNRKSRGTRMSLYLKIRIPPFFLQFLK